ncbi:MAG: copper resistance protein B [Xanthomonadaceae bacterium]|jgi:copper resistance protein B|nr:copper resistance protein B [Xanthomonadaceae bacterium]
MNAPYRWLPARLPRAAMLAALATLPLAVLGQSAPASSSTSMSMDMGAMAGMDHAGMPAASTTVAAPAAAGDTPAAPTRPAPPQPAMDHGGMPGMRAGAMGPAAGIAPAVAAPAGMASMDHAGSDRAPMAGMAAMQGGGAPPNARSADDSDGVGYGATMPHMHGNRALGMLLLDQLETVHGRAGNGQAWQVQGWYGGDRDKLWLRSEGDAGGGVVEDGSVEALWDHAIASYWDSQLGGRHDLGAGPRRDWVALGVQGLAPYWFELAATAYLGPSGRTAARFRAGYELLFTQRLILQPELELNLYGKDDPARRIGAGLSDVRLGWRLRYEIRREFAPYLGIDWVRRVGTTADYARADGQGVFDQQVVAGFRIWF